MPDQKPFLSRPKDRSLEAFKAWMKELFDRILSSDAERDTISDEQWKKDHERFWAKVDEAKK